MLDKTGLSGLKSAPLVAAITTVCSASFLLFGYDQGVMSGVVISKYWLDEVGNPSIVMTATGSQAATTELVMMIVGRIITGMGFGFLTSEAPVYQSEICLPSQRGEHLSCQRTMMLFGLMLAYWINYAFYFHAGAIQWRFPLLFQAVFALYFLFIKPFLPDTPRWLMLHEPTPNRGTTVLAKMRNKSEDDVVVQKERSEFFCEAIAVAIDYKPSGIAAGFFVFAFEACFTWGWMATVWVYPAEILPLKIRSKGAALAAAADFLGNFLFVEFTPPALQNIGYKSYVIFAVFNIVAAADEPVW
ncbi:hypothetical protein N7532_001524 [Penicillium argentinense]|uniref:Major facilitator superfamily (MFS) profile domain-containing protein n=1 Tax=Penicillium argentinense TaxID=1131581 RepID=A0A9W9G2P2_9EURO|nr:uncharacterized protein N7532_001524 [Penicillium argentinense]KAJ5110989.1 hypothetical protein N7532_001524 [Penicillium argentinense]